MGKSGANDHRRVVFVAVLLGAMSARLHADPGPDSQDPRMAGLIARVSRLRGLPVKNQIQQSRVERAVLARRLEERMDAAYSPGYLAASERLLRRFGLLQGARSYKQRVLDLILANTAGFYDPWQHRLYLAKGTRVGDMLLAHEIAHALQDQFFTLSRILTPQKHEHDATLARHALVEGDATALMVELASRETGKGPAWGDRGVVRALAREIERGVSSPKAMDFLGRNLSFPYSAGLAFVAHVRRTRPWRAVDGIYKRPPLSSEQILHPELYDSYQRPDQVVPGAIPALVGATLDFHDCLGEVGIASWLTTHGVPLPRARLAAAGWGGDRFALMARSGSTRGIGVLVTSWDSESDAREFADAADDALRTLAGGKTVALGPLAVHHHADGTVSAGTRRGDRVILVIGASAGEISQAIEQVFTGWPVRRR